MFRFTELAFRAGPPPGMRPSPPQQTPGLSPADQPEAACPARAETGILSQVSRTAEPVIWSSGGHVVGGQGL